MVSALSIFGFIVIAIGLVLLQLAYFFARKKKYNYHYPFMISAIIFNGIFLISYVIRALTEGSEEFPGPDVIKFSLYYPILIVHIALAIVTIFYIAFFVSKTAKRVSKSKENQIYLEPKEFRKYHRNRGTYLYLAWTISYSFGIVIFFMLYVIPW